MLFEELSIMVGGELSDPDLSLVSVTDVIISRDLRNAKIFVSHDDDEVTNGQVLRALKRARLPTCAARSRSAAACAWCRN